MQAADVGALNKLPGARSAPESGAYDHRHLAKRDKR